MSRKPIVFAGCINVYENTYLYPERTIELVEATASDPEREHCNWVDAAFIGTEGRICDVIDFSEIKKKSPNPILLAIHDEFHQLLGEYVTKYYEDYGINENAYTHSNYQLLRYKPRDQYPNHYDGPTELGRHISAILYLNDDYEGGELVFGLHKVVIKPKKGMLLLFPSNYAYQHRAMPVTKGTKYAMVTWLHDRAMES